SGPVCRRIGIDPLVKGSAELIDTRPTDRVRFGKEKVTRWRCGIQSQQVQRAVPAGFTAADLDRPILLSIQVGGGTGLRTRRHFKHMYEQNPFSPRKPERPPPPSPSVRAGLASARGGGLALDETQAGDPLAALQLDGDVVLPRRAPLKGFPRGELLP